MRKKAAIFLMIPFLTLCCLSPVFAEGTSSKMSSNCAKVGDALWIRPLGVIGTGLGALAYAVSYPVTFFLKKTDEAKEFLIRHPYGYTFERPLGEF